MNAVATKSQNLLQGIALTTLLQGAYLTGLGHTVGMGSRLLLTPVGP